MSETHAQGPDDVPYTLEYRPYDSSLPLAFEALKQDVLRAMPGLRVEHVGSSSIPGVGGRNVIDVAIPALAADHAAIKQRLYAMGFADAPFDHYLPVLVGRVSWMEREHDVLLYVISPDSEVLGGWIAFRDHLRAHPDDADEYDRVKRRILGAGRVDGERYQEAKGPVLVALSAKASAARSTSSRTA